MSGERLGDYELVEPVGHGTMGTVWRARQVGRVARQVAIKRVAGGDSQAIARLRREAEALAALDHPHVVGILDVVDDGDGLAIVMVWAAGGSLAELLADLGRLEPAQVVRVVTPVAEALASAHRRGVLHRDVKPSNVVFTGDGEPLLTDFGVARLGDAEPLTDQRGAALGTAEYLDPVVADGGPPDERADQYALGVVAWQALAGRLPYRGETPLATLRAADAGDRPRLAELAGEAPPTLLAAVERACARDPAERFADCRGLADALHQARMGLPPPGADPSGPAPAHAPDAGGHAEPGGTRDFPGSHGNQAPEVASGSDPPASRSPPTGRSGPPPPPPRADSGTRTFGPRPPAPAADDRDLPTGWSRWSVAACVALVLAVAGVAAGAWWWNPADDEPSAEPGAGDDERAAPATPATPAPPADCPDVPRPEVPERAELFHADLDGDGCRAYIAWQAGDVWLYRHPDGSAERAALIGADGDTAELAERAEVAVADWSCDGAETAAVYDPQTGRVHEFRGWPHRAAGRDRLDDDDVVVYDTGTVNGDLRAEVDDDGCADIVIDGGQPAA